MTQADLAAALEEARPRWDDESYFNRILVDQLFRSMRDSETGAGIGLDLPGDNEHDIVRVVRATQQVYVYKRMDRGLRSPIATYSFDDYITKYGG